MKGISCNCLTCKNGCMCDPYARFFDALGNKNRIHIVNSLRSGEKNVTQVVETTGLEQSCVSHCLRLLEKGGFVTRRKEGKFRVYALAKTIEPLMRSIDVHVKRHYVEG